MNAGRAERAGGQHDVLLPVDLRQDLTRQVVSSISASILRACSTRRFAIDSVSDPVLDAPRQPMHRRLPPGADAEKKAQADQGPEAEP